MQEARAKNFWIQEQLRLYSKFKARLKYTVKIYLKNHINRKKNFKTTNFCLLLAFLYEQYMQWSTIPWNLLKNPVSGLMAQEIFYYDQKILTSLK